MSAAAKKPAAPDLLGLLRHEVTVHPYRTIAIAAGLGYLLGTRLGGPLVSLVGSRAGLSLASSLLGPLLQPPAARE
jgi:hypothetical protein